MAYRKTIEVEKVRGIANNMLAKSLDGMTQEREAIATFLERVLFDTGNYHGFKYLTNGGSRGDESRRHYF